MKPPPMKKNVNVAGEIVEIFDSEGQKTIKIHVDPHFLDVALQNKDDIYLGDKVSLDVEITVKKVSLQMPVNRSEEV